MHILMFFFVCIFTHDISMCLLLSFNTLLFHHLDIYPFSCLSLLHFQHISPKSYPLHYIFINCQLTLYNFSCTFFPLSIFTELSNLLISLSFQFTPHQMFFLLILWLPIIVSCLSTTVLCPSLHWLFSHLTFFTVIIFIFTFIYLFCTFSSLFLF